MNDQSDKKFIPPTPVGEPFRADPGGPAPFALENGGAVAGQGDVMTPWMGDVASAEAGFPSLANGAPPSRGMAPPIEPVPPAGEFPPDVSQKPQFRPPPRDAAGMSDPSERLAKIGLAAGIGSIVLSPILGPLAIVLGSIALKRGQTKYGLWALCTGIAGTLIGIVVIVLVATGVIPSLDQMIRDIQNK